MYSPSIPFVEPLHLSISPLIPYLTYTSEAKPRIPPFTITIPSSTRPEDSSEKIKQWLRNCEHYRVCNEQLSTDDFIPSRLMEITMGDDSEISIRLRSGSVLPRTLKYAALSHCWDSFMPVKLLKSRFGEFQETIPWNEISPVFRGAITVAASLDIWCIWVDSLCEST